jgi:hypothetical protein
MPASVGSIVVKNLNINRKIRSLSDRDDRFGLLFYGLLNDTG